MIAESTVGYTKFLFEIKNINKQNMITVNLLKKLASDKTPTGKIIVLAISAAKVEYARQLKYLNNFEVSFIPFDEITPNNLDEKVAREVTKIARTMLVDI